MSEQRAGYVALLGRPNVGKSTLLNCLIEQKISITAPKPQTTRHVILGIHTLPDTQIVYVDTPGLHRNTPHAINHHMNRAASSVLAYVDVVVFVLEALRWNEEDRAVLKHLSNFQGPVILAINKVDKLAEKSRLLPFIEMLSGQIQCQEYIPLSALQGDNIAVLEQRIAALLPVSEFLFPPDQLTTASQRFLAAEAIREKLTRHLSQELPYSLTVEIETFAEQGPVLHIGAVIWVQRPGQKRIVIGEKGAMLKAIGREARQDLEQLLQRRIFLETWVKVRDGWIDDESALRHFGYAD
ncbi:MAG: GTPase Era [Gammaproteobacteria bacterium]|nr:GTPase Era [Gammaproteobacteria bacterium]MCP5424371.1 GTPase Era [Gammaproteobacteria bacterium]